VVEQSPHHPMVKGLSAVTPTAGTRVLYYKTFYDRDLRIFLTNYSVCPWQAYPMVWNLPWS